MREAHLYSRLVLPFEGQEVKWRQNLLSDQFPGDGFTRGCESVLTLRLSPCCVCWQRGGVPSSGMDRDGQRGVDLTFQPLLKRQRWAAGVAWSDGL